MTGSAWDAGVPTPRIPTTGGPDGRSGPHPGDDTPRDLEAPNGFRYGVAVRHLPHKEHCMKVRIDADLCTGCGLCSDSVPEVFEMGSDVAVVKPGPIPQDKEGAVRDAASDCPAEAI